MLYIKMFVVRCSTFHSIVTCLFEFILMPESSLQECFIMFSAETVIDAHLSFLPCLMCASYEVELYMCFELCHVIFTGVQSM